MIRPSDYPVVRAFLHRESKQYYWKKTGQEGRRTFVRRMFETLIAKEGAYEFVNIQSLTNMGYVDAELVLTACPFQFNGSRMVCILPPTPNGGISFNAISKS